MEQTAPPGGLRIHHDTYRHVRGVFKVTDSRRCTVKGSDEPLRTYLVQGAKPRALRVRTRGIEGVETRMVAREAELESLQDAFQALCDGRRLPHRDGGRRGRPGQEPPAARIRELGRGAGPSPMPCSAAAPSRAR